ncbi:hypothetical protein G6F35_011556 [Rhizopus arrhizus]|nr:hypothetical protein G6F35_011556 [Rhizopus arrhizus]
MMRAPVRSCLRTGHAQPGAGSFVARRVATGVAVGAVRQAARQRLVAALPGELHLHAQIAVGRDGCVAGADHDGGKAFRGGRAGPPDGHQRRGFGLRAEAVAVGATLHVGRVQHLGSLSAQVVGGLVDDLQQGVAVAAQFVDRLPAAALRVAFVLGQREQPARRQRTHRARAVEAHQSGFVGAQRPRHALFGGVVVGIAAVSGVVVVLKHRQGFDLDLRSGLRGVGGQRAFVPGRSRDGVRTYGLGRREARNAVAGFRGVAAVKAQGRRRIFGAGGIRIENHHAMACTPA